MAIERQQNPFDAPIPGQSLTDAPKNYVWENPPRFSKPEDASIFIWKRLQNKDIMARIILMLETGVSIEALTRVIIFSGFVEGHFSVDAGILLTPIVEKMILAIGKAAGVKKINLSMPKRNKTEKMLDDIFKSKNFKRDIDRMKAMESKKKTEEVEKESKGLMARPEMEDEE